MQKSLTRKLLQNGVLLSLFLHLLFLLGTTTIIIFPAKKPEKHYVPSYVYSGSITPSPASHATPVESVSKPKQVVEKTLESPQAKNSFLPKKNIVYEKSILDMSRKSIHQDIVRAAVRQIKSAEPMLLIGDNSQMADPLVKLVGRSLSAHFAYPRREGSFGIRGKVVVEMILHPEGYFSDVKVVRSSDNQNFDAAALYAVNMAPTVIGVNKLLKEPKYFIVGFIFD